MILDYEILDMRDMGEVILCLNCPVKLLNCYIFVAANCVTMALLLTGGVAC